MGWKLKPFCHTTRGALTVGASLVFLAACAAGTAAGRKSERIDGARTSEPQGEAPLNFSRATIYVGPHASAQEAMAAKEIQRYLYRISGKKLPIRGAGATLLWGKPAIVVGTWNSFLFPELWWGTGKRPPNSDNSDESFKLHIFQRNGAPTVHILGNSPIGALYGAYTFLEKFGIGFYLGGDVFPGTRVPLKLQPMEEDWKPAFPIRGTVIWYNFLNGPVCWNLDDYKFYFDQMVKMKANLVSFPEYGHGLTDYVSDGKLVPGGPFPTSENYGWGTVRGMKTAEFGIGTGEFFTGLAYGSNATVGAKDREDAIRRSQALFAQAAKYAKRRGIKICLGFELNGLPDQAHIDDVSKRLQVLVSKYPEVDTVWFWQNEAATVGYSTLPADAQLSKAARSFDPHFAYLHDEPRAKEACRIAYFISQAYAALRKIAPEKRVAISGWGGDRWLHFTDLFTGLDEILPKDVVFSALDNIDPSWEPTISEYYGKVAPDRETWAIPWFESDGGGSRHDQFMPECTVKPFSALLPDVLAKKCKGVMGIHWRVRDVEDVARYTFDFAWNPLKTTYDGFWADYALRCFGKGDAPEMTKLLVELDSLGPRWTGGGGQSECAPFTWEQGNEMPKPENLAKLQTVRARLVEIARRDRKAGRMQFVDRLERLIATIDWVTLYDNAAVLAMQAGAAKDPKEAARLVSQMPLGEAMHAYTRLLSTQGEWGVLATVNVKAFAAYEKLWQENAKTSVPAAEYRTDLPFQVAFKQPSGIAIAGEPIPVEVVVVGGRAVKSVTLRYRKLGEGRYLSIPMSRGFRNVYSAAIPFSAVTEAGVEYCVEAVSTSGQVVHEPIGLPSVTVTVLKP